ncbi:dihydroorotate dehydrogenase electron transfer subunit [Rubripirellula amarantea]|uniref:Dihydroorotate dehydrogenase B (NAD(+)), electron transfer subunit n=1 Tax=Rubripirellula amarantea TaxID=2527999 RepID=A0A5C5WQU2_9BACT|nr:dihydroorotate dehydrogenase electron transfer subunit [Rubripirellula amarantea]MDA8743648.1 dihydroorotate dehydrogenase electron transfer subunit [Rubripirellula amarantea]TWT52403.1 Dihydroorotate dehydrogenase B (NAD(+)), electron transfer subunit [Rubripirellula amarantea]
MTKLHADYYADSMTQVRTTIVLNEQIAESTFRLRVEAAPIAANAVPGQFVMIRMAGINAPLIGRALAIYDILDNDQGEPTYVDVIYLRKGALTTPLSSASVGTPIDLWGPLGNGFSNRDCQTLIMAVGGIGQTPMLLLGREALGDQTFGVQNRASGWAQNAEIIYGARNANLLAGVDDFRKAGFEVTLCTDDGSLGQQALVPDVLKERLTEIQDLSTVRVVTCGPEIMMEKVAQLCESMGVDCQVSMETPMACGIGICFSCVAKVNQDDGEWDYKRTCVEGPIFDACKICWD